MADEMFDYNKYYKPMSANAEINIDVSGLDIKSSASSESMNDDGTVDDIGMNEYVTNNVKYYVTGIAGKYKKDGNTVDASISPMDILKVNAYTYSQNSAGFAVESCYTGLNYSLDDLQSVGVELPAQYNKVSTIEISVVEGDPDTDTSVAQEVANLLKADPSITVYTVKWFVMQNKPKTYLMNGSLLVGKIKFTLTPRYELMKDSQNCMFKPGGNSSLFLQAYAGLGFYGKQYLGIKYLNKLLTKDPKIHWDYKNFKKRVDYISNIVNENDLGLDITYYDDHFAADLPSDVFDATKSDYKTNKTKAIQTHIKYLQQKQAADYTNTYSWTQNPIKKNTACSELEGYYTDWLNHVHEFITSNNKDENRTVDLSPNLVDDISETKNGNGTALIPNVSDAFKRFYLDTEPLANEFTDKFNDVLKGLRKMSTLLKLIPRKYRRKLNRFCGILLKNTSNTSAEVSVGKKKRLLDLSLVTRYLYKDANYDNWRVQNKYYARAITEVGHTVYYVDDGKVAYSSTASKPNSAYPQLKEATFDGSKFTVSGTTQSYDILQTTVSYMANKNSKYTSGDYSTTYKNLATSHFIAYDTYTDTAILDYLTDIYNAWFSEKIVKEGCSVEWEWLDPYNVDSLDAIAEFFPVYAKKAKEIGVRKSENIKLNTANPRNYYAMNDGRYMAKGTFTNEKGEVHEIGVIFACTSNDDGTRKSDGGATYMVISKEDPDNPTYATTQSIPTEISDVVTSSHTLASFLASVMPMLNFVRDGKVGDTHSIWGGYEAKGDYNVIQWLNSTTPGDITEKCRNDMPAYQAIEEFSDGDIDINYLAQNALELFSDVIDAMDGAISKMAFLAPGLAIAQKIKLSDVKDDYSDLKNLIKQIIYYERFTNESVFSNKSFIVSSDYGVSTRQSLSAFQFYHMPARFMLPVRLYKKVRVKYKRWGRTRHKMVNRSIGIRWVEVRYIDTSVYGEYPQNDTLPMNEVVIDADATVSVAKDGTITLDFGEDVESTKPELKVGDFTYAKQGIVHLCSAKKRFESDYYYTVNIESGQILVSKSDDGGDDASSWSYSAKDMSLSDDKNDVVKVSTMNGKKVHVWGLQLPLAPTQGNDDLTKVRLTYNMPYIPYDDEIRNKAFVDYGPFDQSKYAIQSRTEDEDDRIDGWKIFYHSSRRIQDMRKGLGVYEALSMLIAILKNTFGENRVQLAETRRSMGDQSKICSGSSESEFLSWHNYGLSARILITKEDLHNPISEDSDDFLKLIDVAEAFTEGCRTAQLCPRPLNIVWCGRLVMGADDFVWEFLPMGVNHKDAPKFRESLLQQRDPVMEFGYVNVDEEHLVYDTAPEDEKAYYVLKSSPAYKNAMIINGDHYIDPSKIRNYAFPSDLLLINISEYVHMIQLKMSAHGSTLTERANMYDWKALNDTSYRQLVQFFGMTGNFSGAKALIAGDFVEKYQMFVDQYFATDQVEFVKNILGDAYEKVKIYITSIGDGGAYLMLHDGKLHMRVTDVRPAYNMNSREHFFGQQQVNPTTLERGRWIGGVFYNTVEVAVLTDKQLEYVSDDPVIGGYSRSGEVTGGDALLLHSMVATQIKNVIDDLKNMFENYAGALMYDHFEDGPNAGMYNMLENEFGLISAQDLMDFDALRNMVYRNRINQNAGKSSDGTVLGAGVDEESRTGIGGGGGNNGTKDNGTYWESIFEKVVSNAQLSGVREASLTKEHVLEPVKSNPLTTEQLYKIIQQGRGFTANDIIK